MPPALRASSEAEERRAQAARRGGLGAWALIAAGVLLLIAAASLFWWGRHHLPTYLTSEFLVRVPPAGRAGNTQAAAPGLSKPLTPAPESSATSSATRFSPSSVARPRSAFYAAHRREKKFKPPRAASARLKRNLECRAGLRETTLNHLPAEAMAGTQVAGEAQAVAAPAHLRDPGKTTQETLSSASATSPATPQPTPSPECADKRNKPNIFRRIVNSVIGIFKKRRADTSCPNLPPSVTLSASQPAITRSCPLGTTSSCAASPSQVIKLSTAAADPDRDKLQYAYTATGGRIAGDGASVSWDLSEVQPGTYTATVEVSDGKEKGQNYASTTVVVAECQDCRQPCPTIQISCPTEQMTPGMFATLSANVSGGDPSANITYNWTVSAGTITDGQGTPSITVDTTGLEGQNVTATVELGGVAPECNRTESCIFSVAQPISDSRKFDEYSSLRFNDEKARLDNFAMQLQQEPGSHGYYIVFGTCEGKAAARAARAIDYLVNRRAIDRNRVTAINGGCRAQLTIELWIAGQGGLNLIPNNTATVSPCPRCPSSRNGRLITRRGTGAISGMVLDIKNSRVAGATVTAVDKDGKVREVSTDENGNFTLAGLPPGEYKVTVTYDGVRSETFTVTVTPKQTTQISSPIKLPIEVGTPTTDDKVKVKKEADLVKIRYPDKFLKGVGSTVTFVLKREWVPTEFQKSQTFNANTGEFEVVEKYPSVPGAKPGQVSPEIHDVYDTYIRVELIPKGLTVPSERAVQEKLYIRANDGPDGHPEQEWDWTVTPIPGYTGATEILFRVTVIWRSPTNPKDVREHDPQEFPLPVKIGESAFLVYGATYGAPLLGLGAVGAIGVGAKRRKKLLAGEIEEEGVEDLPPAAAEEAEDEVSGTVYAPGQARPGDFFFVQVFLHLPAEAALLEEWAKMSDEDARMVDYSPLDKKIERGTELTLHLTMNGLDIDDEQKSCTWEGKRVRVRFGVTVPEKFKPKDIRALVVIAENSVPIGHLSFKFKIVRATEKKADDSPTKPARVGRMKRYRQAFISYASEDRQEVTKRVQMLNLVKIGFFEDLINLEPGDRYKKLIYQYIDKSDVFFLFWSAAASKSKWVKKEVNYAIKHKAGKDEAPPEIIPVIIEGPPPAKPPRSLKFLHFNDKFIYFINTRETEAKRDSL